MMLIHGKSHLVMGARKSKRAQWRQKKHRRDEKDTAWWTERQPQGPTVSLHEFPHVSICNRHLFFLPSVALVFSTYLHLLSMTDSNNSLENIYLAKVPKSHVVTGCENAQWAEDAVMFFFLRCENYLVAFSDGEDELQNDIHHIKKCDVQIRKMPEVIYESPLDLF